MSLDEIRSPKSQSSREICLSRTSLQKLRMRGFLLFWRTELGEAPLVHRLSLGGYLVHCRDRSREVL